MPTDSAPAEQRGLPAQTFGVPAALRRRLYGLGFVDELGPIYGVYTIWFSDNGISASQVSTVFLLWAIVAIVFEVPSGAVADLVDRRLLLAVAFVLRAIGIAIWIVEPSFAGILVGAALWSIHSSLASGAWEALIHDELTGVGASARYASTMARIEQCSAIGILSGTAIATVVLWLGGTIEQLGWATVALHAVSVWLVLRLADVRWVARAGSATDDEPVGEVDDPSAGWFTILLDGVRFVARHRLALRLLVIGSIVEGLYIVDDYVPLLARERGATDATVPVFVGVIFVGLVVGDEIVVRRPGLSGRVVGAGLAGGGVAVIVAMLTTSMWPLLLVGIAYLAQEIAVLVSDARFQEHVPPARRATATSVRSFVSAVVSVVAIGLVTALSTSEVSVWALAGFGAVLCATGLLAARWLPLPVRRAR